MIGKGKAAVFCSINTDHTCSRAACLLEERVGTYISSSRHRYNAIILNSSMIKNMKLPLFACGWIALLLLAVAEAEIITKEVSYQVQDTSLRGYLAYQADADTKHPAVLVVHEWWGHNAYARKRAEMLAELGYVAFALDMYGEGKVAEHPDDAKKFMQEALANQDTLHKRFNAAITLLQQQENVDAKNIAAIGYCFGGGVVLNMARAGTDLKGVVSFHGSLSTKTPAEAGNVRAKVVVFHGSNDAFIPEEQVKAFEQEMTAAKVDYELIVYEGVEHSFTNPEADRFAEQYSMPLSYDEEADQHSWEQMQKYLAEMFSH